MFQMNKRTFSVSNYWYPISRKFDISGIHKAVDSQGIINTRYNHPYRLSYGILIVSSTYQKLISIYVCMCVNVVEV